MERPTMLIQAMLQQCSIDLDLSVDRDVQTIVRRAEHEGMAFLSLTLPLLSDALLEGIERGWFLCPTNFSRHRSLPKLLRGFFNLVFSEDGELRSDASPDGIRAIRSICDFWKKPKIPCSPQREAAALLSYKNVEAQLVQLASEIDRKDDILDAVSKVIWPTVFQAVDHNTLWCKHGPGNTADRRRSNERHRHSNWYARFEQWFPSALHAYPNYGYAAEQSGTHGAIGRDDFFWTESEEPPVRVVFVPKTLKSPRVIALEPSPMQFVQQSLLDALVPLLESHKLTRKSLRFSDQSVNQRLAHKASIDQSLATLDLKDASDRVSLRLVDRIFGGTDVHQMLVTARSSTALLPDGSVCRLEKFASMGSATCFPVEAMVFYTIIQAALHRHRGVRPTQRSIAAYSREISVYGDDIIVPVDTMDAVVHYLESYGLKVNLSKTFRNSHFRESCGADFYDGVWVRPIYARQEAPESARDWTASHILSWTATANQLYLAGMWHVAQVVREMLESVLRLPVPRSSIPRGGGIHFASVMFTTHLRYEKSLHAWRQKRLVLTPVKTKDNIDGDAIACLNKWGSTVKDSSRWDPLLRYGVLHQKSIASSGDPFPLRHFGAELFQPYDGIQSSSAALFSREQGHPDNDRCLPKLDKTALCGAASEAESAEPEVQSVPPGSHRCLEQRVHCCKAVALRPGSEGSERFNCYELPSLEFRGEEDRDESLERLSYGARAPKTLSFLEHRKLLLQEYDERSVGIDFRHSVKRGHFKSKVRWVTTFS